jgi:hypothetical protein
LPLVLVGGLREGSAGGSDDRETGAMPSWWMESTRMVTPWTHRTVDRRERDARLLGQLAWLVVL